ncbi:jg9098 [Pararge aegeria aegeria]|uniref:Jg9098 protein n=1 Tax=Pararge aegeria aegeria TaxID=348720 RepID=A0A8S4RU27_9NEOP|nr:jg9098 [Pararge aegeria aegeria]
MEAVRLFLLKIILSAVVLNIIIVKNTAAYSNISTNDGRQDKSPHRKSWSSKSSNTEAYKYMPPYLVFNKKVGAYYPYFKYPGDNNLRRMGAHKSRQWKG